MIKVMNASHDNVVGIEVSGKLDDTAYKETLTPRLEALFEQHAKSEIRFHTPLPLFSAIGSFPWDHDSGGRNGWRA